MPNQHINNPKIKRKVPYNFLLHIHPKKVNSETLRFNLTFGLGGMSAFLVVFQVFTGLLLKFHYAPSPELAYDSILELQNNLLFGQLARNLHHWSAVFLVWTTFLHMLRVLFTGAYRKPRHVNWIFGFFLLILVILANFTGYLLPWDQLSYWAITISTSLLRYFPVLGEQFNRLIIGGEEVGAQTLANFFNLHTGFIPLLMFILMAFHFWKIRKAGGVVVAESKKDGTMTDVYPSLISREFVVATVLLAILLVLSVFFDAPLQEKANPSVCPNPAKAPWYFMGLQELLIHFHPVVAVFIFPLFILVAAIWLPFIKLDDRNQGIWFLSEKGIYTAKLSAAAAIFITIAFILSGELFPDPEQVFSTVPSFVTKGIVPLIFMLLTIWVFLQFLRGRFRINRSEFVQSIIIILIVSYSVLSLTGIFFRGEGMRLMWPWQIF